MILAADVRNGGISFGVQDPAGSWVCRFRLSAAQRSIDEWTFLVASLLRERGVAPESLRYGALSSVVPVQTPVFMSVLQAFLPAGGEPLLVGPGVRTGLRIRTDNPAELGSDLVCNAVAAAARLGTPCVAVDFGSTLTFTAVNAAGDLVGAALAPGLGSAAEELRLRTALLPQVRLEQPARAIGKNSADAVRSGLMIGWSGLTDRLVEAISEELGPDGQTVRLAGTGPYEAPPILTRRSFDLWDPALTLEGLVAIARRAMAAG